MALAKVTGNGQMVRHGPRPSRSSAAGNPATLADRPPFRRVAELPGIAAAEALLRILPAEDRGAGGPALVLHPPAGAAAAALRLRHLWRGWHHPGPHPCDGGPDRPGDQPDPGR